MIYHKLHIGYHEPSTNLMILKLYLHFIQLKNIATACGFSWFANNMFKISSNFMSKVLKMIQLHGYDFSTNFTTLFYGLAVQIWHIRQKFFKWHIIVKNSKLIETCIWLKCIVQNNVFEVEKLKDVQKTIFWKYFAVRCGKTHGKHISLPCVFLWRTANIYLCRAFSFDARQRPFSFIFISTS
jgi:hypothetical protein